MGEREHILDWIDSLRRELAQAVEEGDALASERVIRISHRLDRVILAYQRHLNSRSQRHPHGRISGF